jgi:hypothetical protein
VLIRTQYLSLDPYMRGRMSDAPSYAPPVEVGGVMVGGTIGEVVESRSAELAVGDVVLAYNGWQKFGVARASLVRKLDPGFIGMLEGTELRQAAHPGLARPACTGNGWRPQLAAPVLRDDFDPYSERVPRRLMTFGCVKG